MIQLQIDTLVRHRTADDYGVVRGHPSGMPSALIEWLDTGATSWIDVTALTSGLHNGQEVLHCPDAGKVSFGVGLVLQTRPVGTETLHLVEFFDARQRVWMPWRLLKPVQHVRTQFARGVQVPVDAPERFRLRQLAYALGGWDQNLTSLADVNVDPLPHQLYLVHRILSSGNLNWLIADDVGLGKTIEVGLLITALRQRGLRRILLVVPPSLTEQWQAELRTKFHMPDFQIFGTNFTPTERAHWRAHDAVIASMDLLKQNGHLELLQESGDWDLVVFDEAHRLSREEHGRGYTTSARYALAQVLRELTDGMLLLSGTPHQGKESKFHSLLSLLRPGSDWAARFAQMELHPELLADLIIRNRKSDAVDAQGRFIFQGKRTEPVHVTLSEAEREFDVALQRYLRKGYSSAEGSSGSRRMIIHLVMTTYRKLAASSIAAIQVALERRLERLLKPDPSTTSEPFDGEADFELDEGSAIDRSGTAFFQGEDAMLRDLIGQARGLRQQDSKLRYFLRFLNEGMLTQNADEKLLIFTEYRTTQQYLVEALARTYGANKVSVIRGGQPFVERKAAIEHFEQEGQFLVSTEAGGEGLNLQRACHIMVNYDLPWNPMRLVQRVGRLYRYGQERTVEVYNMRVTDSIDEDIVGILHDRLDRVALDMAGVSADYRDGLHEDILGDLASAADFEELLERVGMGSSKARTQEEIDAAIARAKDGTRHKQSLLSHASSFRPDHVQDRFPLTHRHLIAFVRGMLPFADIDITESTHADRVWRLRLPDELQRKFRLHTTLRVTFDRTLAQTVRDAVYLDTATPLVRYLLTLARSFNFGGQVAAIDYPAGYLLSAVLRWQDDAGITLEQEYVTLSLNGTEIDVNPEGFSDWLLEPAVQAETTSAPSPAELTLLEHALLSRLERHPTLHPETYALTGAAWGEAK